MTSDLPALLIWLRGACDGPLLQLSVDAAPSANHRPRVARFGTYYAKDYVTYKAACIEQFCRQVSGDPLEGRLLGVIETRVARPKSTKLADPLPDVDNYCKPVMDASEQSGAVVNDKYFKTICTTKRWCEPGEEPGCVLHIGVRKQH